MSKSGWEVLETQQFPGKPEDFTKLATFWRGIETSFCLVKKPATQAIGVSAKNFDTSLEETEYAFSEVSQEAGKLAELCEDWAKNLKILQQGAEAAASKAEEAHIILTNLQRKIDIDEELNSLEKEEKREAKQDLHEAKTSIEALQGSYSHFTARFRQKYIAPKFTVIEASTNSQSPLGRKFSERIGHLQEKYPGISGGLNFIDSMMPFNGDGSIKSIFFYNDVLFNGIGSIHNALSSFRLGVDPKSGGKPSKFLSKTIKFSDNIYYPNPIKEKLKLTSNAMKGYLKRADIEGFLKRNIASLDDGTKKLLGNTDDLTNKAAKNIREALPEFKLPEEVKNKKLTPKTNIFEKIWQPSSNIKENAQFLKQFDGKIGKFADYMPTIGKLTKRIPVIGWGISGHANYKSFYDSEAGKGLSEGERKARAVGASFAVTGSGIIGGAASGAAAGALIGSIFPGVGTAIGGVIGGFVGGVLGSMAGEQTAKHFGWDKHLANFTGGIFNSFNRKK